jgi:hypothetical protein
VKILRGVVSDIFSQDKRGDKWAILRNGIAGCMNGVGLCRHALKKWEMEGYAVKKLSHISVLFVFN